jgi:hypothetical protein
MIHATSKNKTKLFQLRVAWQIITALWEAFFKVIMGREGKSTNDLPSFFCRRLDGI